MGESDLDAAVERANEAYWETDAGVNQIAEDLDLSKSALYGMIMPLETGSLCLECGGPLSWENRTARDRDTPVCLTCEAAAEAGGSDPQETLPPSQPKTARAAEGAPGDRPLNWAGVTVRADDARTLGGAVLVGIGTGFLAAVLLMRKR